MNHMLYTKANCLHSVLFTVPAVAAAIPTVPAVEKAVPAAEKTVPTAVTAPTVQVAVPTVPAMAAVPVKLIVLPEAEIRPEARQPHKTNRVI